MSGGGKEQRRIDRFIVIPFSACRSGSSVDVVNTRHATKQPPPPQGGGEGGGGKPKGESLVARLLRGFKNLSQIFAVYDDDDDEDEEPEMVIGLPTDVKHVAHIGWDGSTSTTSSVRSWDRATPPPSSSSASTSTPAPPPPPPQPHHHQQQQEQPPSPLPGSFSMRQFELAMAAQAAASTTTGTSRRRAAS